MPKRLKTPKVVTSLSVTEECLALANLNAKKLGITRNDYIERCIRKGDNEIYNLAIETTKALIRETRERVTEHERVTRKLKGQEEKLVNFLKLLGVSLNEIP